LEVGALPLEFSVDNTLYTWLIKDAQRVQRLVPWRGFTKISKASRIALALITLACTMSRTYFIRLQFFVVGRNTIGLQTRTLARLSAKLGLAFTLAAVANPITAANFFVVSAREELKGKILLSEILIKMSKLEARGHLKRVK
jgi:hypothetical protein